MKASTSAETEVLVLSGRGIRFGVAGHYGTYDEKTSLAEAFAAARDKLAGGHARAFVTIRIEAKVIGGVGTGTDRELACFEVYTDRVALVPSEQGGLSDEQRDQVLGLPEKGLI